MIRISSRAALLLLALGACGGERKDAAAQDDSTMASVNGVDDSLVLSTPEGVQVWFTAARPAADSAGNVCVERTMEIRRDGKATPIPLLYTGVGPSLVNDSTIEALLYLHCRPMSRYHVDLHTGQPVRVE